MLGSGACGAAVAVCALPVAAGAARHHARAAKGGGLTRVLYDSALGTSPGSQGWLFYATGGTETKPRSPQGAGAAGFSTMKNPAFRGGYSTVSPFPLDRRAGYTVGFDLRVTAEAHAAPNRGGVDLIVLGHDARGLELAFWTGQVWAQSDRPLFLHAEGAAWDATAPGRGAAGLTHYELRVRDGAYRLTADGHVLLSGPIRDYTAFNGPINPYRTPDFLFLGDDTHEAAGAFRISRVWVRREGGSR